MDRCRMFLAALALLLASTCDAPLARAEETQKTAAEIQKPVDDYEMYELLADTIDQVERNYVKTVSRRELIEAAIDGILGRLDPYSNYINPDEFGRFKTAVESQFGGIGIQITIDDGQLKILSPLIGSPAYRAGLLAGDSIVEIDGKPTDNITLDEAVRRLKGDAGSSATITIIHPDSTKKQSVTIRREVVHVETVLGDHRRDDDTWDFLLDHEKKIGYIRIIAFSRDTAADLKRALESLQSQGFKGLVVDVRFDPGGLLTSAIEICDLFVSEGRIVSTEGRNVPESAWEAKKEGTFEGFPMAVLVNRYSASASEIFAACLQDHHRAVIIGERTWGKGSVQNVVTLQNGRSALKLTTASYRRPSGKNIHRFPDSKDSDEWGVLPDSGFEVKLTDRETSDLIRNRRGRDILISHLKPSATDASPTGDAGDALVSPKETAKSNPAKPETAIRDKPAVSEQKPAPGIHERSAASDDDESPALDDEKPAAEGDRVPPPSARSSKFVDLQLQKAIEYLTEEISRPLAAQATQEPKR